HPPAISRKSEQLIRRISLAPSSTRNVAKRGGGKQPSFHVRRWAHVASRPSSCGFTEAGIALEQPSHFQTLGCWSRSPETGGPNGNAQPAICRHSAKGFRRGLPKPPKCGENLRIGENCGRIQPSALSQRDPAVSDVGTAG